MKKFVIFTVVILSLFSCRKECNHIDKLKGKLKVIEVHYVDTFGIEKILPYVLKYNNTGFLSQIMFGYNDTVYFDIVKVNDSLIKFTCPDKIVSAYDYTITLHNNIIKQINYIDSSGIEKQYVTFNRNNDSISSVDFVETDPAGFLFGYSLSNIIYSDSNYIQSKLDYTIILPTLIHFSHTSNYTFSNVLNNGGIPEQFPISGVGNDAGFIPVGLEHSLILYFCSINKYYGFKPNKYLIKSVNGNDYEYQFNSLNQVILLRDPLKNVFHSWQTFVYYD